jgi:hypothetical protein
MAPRHLAQHGVRSHRPVPSAGYDAANRVQTCGGASYSHDANGNLVTDGRRLFTWNVRNELTAVCGGPYHHRARYYDAGIH